MRESGHRWTFLLFRDWTWWAWAVTAVLLTFGLAGHPTGFYAAIGLTLTQTGVMLVREKSLAAFPVQLRLAYALLLIVCLVPQLHSLFWLPTVGTYALVIFGYCLMARVLSLLPWNRRTPISWDLLRRTFFSRPSLPLPKPRSSFSCAGGLCTIEAQVRSC